ncbi:MAG: transposase [Phycisphaeraceae bacterium]|nr:transposase [Phycisphaeraceae bacterium]
MATDRAISSGIVKRHGAKLPHWTRESAAYAVTFRLEDSLPASVLRGWLAEREDIVKRAAALGRPLSVYELTRLDELHSERIERYLDAGHGACWMNKPEIAELIQNAVLHFDLERYRIFAWCVMPNHVHVILQPLPAHELPGVLHSWKSFTSLQANRLLGRSGMFWQSEYYDHLIRDRTDLARQIAYVLRNPASAGLVDWPWVGRRSEALLESVFAPMIEAPATASTDTAA